MKLIGYIITFILLGCEKIYYYPDKSIEIITGQHIAHRGGRTSTIRENTLEGIKSALRYMEGVEIDVQISKNETVWLSHSEMIYNCGTDKNCFPETTDGFIKSITTCNGLDISYTQLETVFQLIRDSFPSKLIFVDLKGWVPCSINSLDIDGMMRRESEIIIELANKYTIGKNVKFEIEPTTVLDYIQSKKSQLETYYISYGQFERSMLIALKQGYSGLSYKNNVGEKLTKEKIELLHKKGLKIIVWNINNHDEITELEAINVDYIQYDLE